MKVETSIQRTMLAGVVALTTLVGGGSAVMAQGSPTPDFEPDYFESMLTGYEVEIAGDAFTIENVVQQNYTDGENEQIQIVGAVDTSSGVVPGLVEVSFLDDEDSPDETIELWMSGVSEDMDTFEIVDSGQQDDVTWYFATGEFEGGSAVFYIQVAEDVVGNIDVLESVFTWEESLADVIQAASEDITIDGEAFMDDVDPDDLVDLVDSISSRDGDDDDETGTEHRS